MEVKLVFGFFFVIVVFYFVLIYLYMGCYLYYFDMGCLSWINICRFIREIIINL